MRQVLALLCVKRRRDTEAHTRCVAGRETNAVLSQSCQCHILQKRPVTNFSGLRNWLKNWFFSGHTRLLPVYVWLIQVFLGLLLVRIGSQTFAYIVFSCEKGMTVMDQMLLLYCSKFFLQIWDYVKPVYLIAFFLCSLVACVSAALSLSFSN